MSEGNLKQYSIAAAKQFFVTTIFLFVQVVIFFVSAGYVDVRTWIYFGTAFVHYVVSTVVLFKLNPELVVQRLKRKREGSKLWDEILMRLSNLAIIILVSAIAGLDFRFIFQVSAFRF